MATKNPPQTKSTEPELVYDRAAFRRWWGEVPEIRAGLIIQRYRRELSGWDDSRISRLCRLANCSVQELFARVCGENKGVMVAPYFCRDSWPLRYTLHLAEFESFLIQRKTGYVPEEVFVGHQAQGELVVRALKSDD